MLSNNPKSDSPREGTIYCFFTLLCLCAVFWVAACTSETDEPQYPVAGNSASAIQAAGTSGLGDPMGTSGTGVMDTAGAQAPVVTGGTMPNNTAGTGGSISSTTGGMVAAGSGGVVAAGTGGMVPAGTGGVVTAGTGGIVVTGGMGGMVATGGMGGEAGTAGVAGTDVPTEKVFPPRCNGDTGGVAMVGDSYWALTGDIYRFLREYSGQQYRSYYMSGTMMAGGLNSIPTQARTAYAQAPVKTLLMDGGGNDCIMNTSCTTQGMASPTCMNTIDHALDVACEMLHEAVENGVQEIIFYYYPYNNNMVWSRFTNPINDYAIPIIGPCCDNLPGADCTFIDTREHFEGHPEYLSPLDGFHPSRSGSEVIAQLMWAAMEDNCQNGIDLSQ